MFIYFGLSILFFSIVFNFFTPSFVDTLDHSRCKYSDPFGAPPPLPNPTSPSGSTYSIRRIRANETLCLPTLTSTSTISLKPIVVTPSPDSPNAFFEFLNLNYKWVKDAINEETAIWFRTDTEWSEKEIEEKLYSSVESYDVENHRFPFESLPHHFYSIAPHQHTLPGAIIFFVKNQVNDPRQGATAFHSWSKLQYLGLEPMLESNDSISFYSGRCWDVFNNCTIIDGNLRLRNAEPYQAAQSSQMQFIYDRKEFYSLRLTKLNSQMLHNGFARLLALGFTQIIEYFLYPRNDMLVEEQWQAYWEDYQIIRPNRGDVMIGETWKQPHSRIGSPSAKKKYIVRELFEKNYIQQPENLEQETLKFLHKLDEYSQDEALETQVGSYLKNAIDTIAETVLFFENR